MRTGLRKFIVSVVLMVLLIAGGVMIAGWLSATRPPAERTAEPAPPPLVNVEQVVLEDIREFFVGYGSARADRDIRLTAEVSGVIVETAPGLNDGALADAGTLLVRIDDRQYRHQLARTEAMAADARARLRQLEVEKSNIGRLAAIAEQELEVNRDEFYRLGGLFEQDLASKKEYDFARLAYERSRRGLQGFKNELELVEPRREALEALHLARLAESGLARLDIERCWITAPFAGQVEHVSVDVGDRVLIGSELLRFMSTRTIEVPIELPASVRAQVELGARCLLEVDSMPGVHWDGRVARISPSADDRSRTFAAYVDVDNTRQARPLVPGYFVRATVEGQVLRQVLAVPRGVIVEDHVYVVNDEIAHLRAVRVERYVGERAIVTGALRPGDRLILTNLDVLFDGANVRVGTGRTAGLDDGAYRNDPVIAGGAP